VANSKVSKQQWTIEKHKELNYLIVCMTMWSSATISILVGCIVTGTFWPALVVIPPFIYTMWPGFSSWLIARAEVKYAQYKERRLEKIEEEKKDEPERTSKT